MPLYSLLVPANDVAAVKDQFDLMTKMTSYNLSERLNPEQVSQHPLMTVGPTALCFSRGSVVLSFAMSLFFEPR